MYKFLKRFTIFLFIWMVFFSIIDKLKADDLLIYYSSNESSEYSNLKSEFEGLGTETFCSN